MSKTVLPLMRLGLGPNTVEYSRKATESGWWTGGSGEFNERLIEHLRPYGRYVLPVNSGTSACRAALYAAVQGASYAGSGEVLTTAYSCAANVSPIYELRCHAVFCDVDRSLGISAGSFLSQLNQVQYAGAMFLPYIYGEKPSGAEQIANVCKKRGIVLIGDISEALGISPKHAVGDIKVASMRTEKMVGAGEAGVVITDDPVLFARAKQFAERGKPDAGLMPYLYSAYGDNLLMPHLTAAIACGQFEILPQVLKGKRRAAGLWRASRLSKILDFQPFRKGPASDEYEGACWLNFGVVRDDVILISREVAAILNKSGVETRPPFTPLYRYWKSLTAERVNVEEFPVTQRMWQQGIVLPSPWDLTEEEVGAVEILLKEVM